MGALAFIVICGKALVVVFTSKYLYSSVSPNGRWIAACVWDGTYRAVHI
jgi:hypothetical protein